MLVKILLDASIRKPHSSWFLLKLGGQDASGPGTASSRCHPILLCTALPISHLCFLNSYPCGAQILVGETRRLPGCLASCLWWSWPGVSPFSLILQWQFALLSSPLGIALSQSVPACFGRTAFLSSSGLNFKVLRLCACNGWNARLLYYKCMCFITYISTPLVLFLSTMVETHITEGLVSLKRRLKKKMLSNQEYLCTRFYSPRGGLF